MIFKRQKDKKAKLFSFKKSFWKLVSRNVFKIEICDWRFFHLRKYFGPNGCNCLFTQMWLDSRTISNYNKFVLCLINTLLAIMQKKSSRKKTDPIKMDFSENRSNVLLESLMIKIFARIMKDFPSKSITEKLIEN